MELLNLIDLNLCRDPRALCEKRDHGSERTNIKTIQIGKKKIHTAILLIYFVLLENNANAEYSFTPLSNGKNRLKGNNTIGATSLEKRTLSD